MGKRQMDRSEINMLPVATAAAAAGWRWGAC